MDRVFSEKMSVVYEAQALLDQARNIDFAYPPDTNIRNNRLPSNEEYFAVWNKLQLLFDDEVVYTFPAFDIMERTAKQHWAIYRASNQIRDIASAGGDTAVAEQDRSKAFQEAILQRAELEQVKAKWYASVKKDLGII